jgi:hypothetical protein
MKTTKNVLLLVTFLSVTTAILLEAAWCKWRHDLILKACLVVSAIAGLSTISAIVIEFSTRPKRRQPKETAGATVASPRPLSTSASQASDLPPWRPQHRGAPIFLAPR